MRERDEQAFQRKKAEIMEVCFDCYAENGLTGTGIQALADACGMSNASLYTYFDSLDDLIVQSTAYCMSKVENEFMQLAPRGWRILPDSSMRCPTGRQSAMARSTG